MLEKPHSPKWIALMHAITVYYAGPGPAMAAALAGKPDRPLATLALGRAFVCVTHHNVAHHFRFSSRAHAHTNAQGQFVPLGDPANDLFDSHGQPLPNSLTKSVAGVVLTTPIAAALATLRVQTSATATAAALNFATQTQQNPPAYCTSHTNCAGFAAQVARAGGVDLAALAQKAKIRNPLDLLRSFQQAQRMLTEVTPGIWTGSLQGKPAELRYDQPEIIVPASRNLAPRTPHTSPNHPR